MDFLVTLPAQSDSVPGLEFGLCQKALSKDVMRGEVARTSALNAAISVTHADERTPKPKAGYMGLTFAKRDDQSRPGIKYVLNVKHPI
jgi:hypothetical protein